MALSWGGEWESVVRPTWEVTLNGPKWIMRPEREDMIVGGDGMECSFIPVVHWNVVGARTLL